MVTIATSWINERQKKYCEEKTEIFIYLFDLSRLPVGKEAIIKNVNGLLGTAVQRIVLWLNTAYSNNFGFYFLCAVEYHFYPVVRKQIQDKGISVIFELA